MFETPDAITRDMLFDMPILQTDAAIVLGARSASGTLARRAAELYHGGAFSKIVLCGGLRVFQPSVLFALSAAGYFRDLPPPMDFLTCEREADCMLRVLGEEGVPAHAIHFIDSRSRNTGENFKFIREALAPFASATLITLAPHQLRALGTAEIQLGLRSPLLFTHAVYPFGITRENWARSPLASAVLAEAKKIDPDNTDPATSYIAQGFCRFVSRNELTARISRLRPNPAPRLYK